MPSTERWLLIHTSTPARISSRAMSAWMSEKPMAKSGCSARMRSIFALVNADTFGFSRRACGGRTVNPEMPTMRFCSPMRYSTSVGSSVRQTMRRGKRSVMGSGTDIGCRSVVDRLSVVGCRLSVVGSEARKPRAHWEPTQSAIFPRPPARDRD
jgi:hypothetical protein